MNLQLVVPSQTFSKVSPLEVEQWLDQKDASFLEIVDLRQQDFAGGNIPGRDYWLNEQSYTLMSLARMHSHQLQ
jgi:hypothetical protein